MKTDAELGAGVRRGLEKARATNRLKGDRLREEVLWILSEYSRQHPGAAHPKAMTVHAVISRQRLASGELKSVSLRRVQHVMHELARRFGAASYVTARKCEQAAPMNANPKAA